MRRPIGSKFGRTTQQGGRYQLPNFGPNRVNPPRVDGVKFAHTDFAYSDCTEIWREADAAVGQVRQDAMQILDPIGLTLEGMEGLNLSVPI